MAYPLEKEHVQYREYVERYSLGEEGSGPKLTKEQWRDKRALEALEKKNADPDKKAAWDGLPVDNATDYAKRTWS